MTKVLDSANDNMSSINSDESKFGETYRKDNILR